MAADAVQPSACGPKRPQAASGATKTEERSCAGAGCEIADRKEENGSHSKCEKLKSWPLVHTISKQSAKRWQSAGEEDGLVIAVGQHAHRGVEARLSIQAQRCACIERR